MVSTVRVDLKSSGIRQVADSPAMNAEVTRIAENIGARARANTDDEIVVRGGYGNSRGRAYVVRLGSGAAGEAKDRALGRSIGGA
jgi:hypothetical protein